MRINVREFLEFAKSLEGQTLRTLAKKTQFEVEVLPKGLRFIPLSTRKTRVHNLDYIQRVHEKFEKTESFRPADYKFTVMASYHLAVISRFMRSKNS